MDQRQVEERSMVPSADGILGVESADAEGATRAASVAPGAQPCSACATAAVADPVGAARPSYVYAVGRIEPRFPSLSVEKEFAQATGRAETSGLTDRQVVHEVLSERSNRYLARMMCWVMTIAGMETYILVPRDSRDLELLVDTLRTTPGPGDLDCVIGIRGPIAPPEMCGLTIPIVGFDQIYSFDRESLIQAIPRPENVTAEEFGPAAAELFDRLMQMTDNVGATDEHRAMNYLAVRYHAIYAAVANAFARDGALSSVEVVSSHLSVTRNVVNVIFSFTNRTTDVTEKLFVRVDITEEFPFLVTRLSPYYDR